MANSPLKQLLKDSQPPQPATSDPPMTSPSVISGLDPFLLDFELLDGNHVALPYSSLLFLSINPSDKLVVMFASHTVRIEGLFLRPIYYALVVKSVAALKAVGDRPRKLPEGVPIIHKMEINERT